MSLKDTTPKELDFLVKKTLELDAIDAKIISTYKIFVEKRVILKCRGCLGYGKKLACPPHVPTVDEFREILKEYKYALLVKFTSPAIADEEIAKAPYKTWLDPTQPEETRKKQQSSGQIIMNATKKYCYQCSSLKKQLLMKVLPLQSHS